MQGDLKMPESENIPYPPRSLHEYAQMSDRSNLDSRPMLFPSMPTSLPQKDTEEKLQEVMDRLDIVVEKLEDLKTMRNGYSLRNRIWR